MRDPSLYISRQLKYLCLQDSNDTYDTTGQPGGTTGTGTGPGNTGIGETGEGDRMGNNLTDRFGMNENVRREGDDAGTVVGNKYTGNYDQDIQGGGTGMGAGTGGITSGMGGNTASGMSGLNRTDTYGNTDEADFRAREGGQTGQSGYSSTGDAGGYSQSGDNMDTSNTGLTGDQGGIGGLGAAGTTGGDYSNDSGDNYSSGNAGYSSGDYSSGTMTGGTTQIVGGAGGFDQAGEGYA